MKYFNFLRILYESILFQTFKKVNGKFFHRGSRKIPIVFYHIENLENKKIDIPISRKQYIII